MFYLDFEELNTTKIDNLIKISIYGNKKIVNLPQYSDMNKDISFEEIKLNSIKFFENKKCNIQFCSNEGLCIFLESIIKKIEETPNSIIIFTEYNSIIINEETRIFFDFKSINQILIFNLLE